MGKALYDAQLEAYRQVVEQALTGYLPTEAESPSTLARAMAYACAAGGKRLRPVLTLAFSRLCGGNDEAALPFACAVEMIHSYSLAHDDLPCMDNSPLRRGRPSAHAAFGEDMALLAGDGLLTAAFEVMLHPSNRCAVAPQAAMQAAFVLANAAGARGMVGGQVMDLEGETTTLTLEELEELQQGKTAALIAAACEMGALVGGGNAAQCAAAAAYGRYLGLGFQIVDDILDVTASEQTLGKPIHSDAVHDKNTYVSLLGLEAARKLASRRTEKALEALSVFEERADALRGLAQALLTREY